MSHHKKKYNINQLGGYMIHDIIVTECDKYLSTTKLKPVTNLAEVIKLHGVNVLNMMPNKRCPVLKFTWAQ